MAILVLAFVLSFEHSGKQWSPPAVLNSSAFTDFGLDNFPEVATDGEGNWVAVWQSESTLGGTIGFEGDILTARSTDNGATWSSTVPLNTNAATDVGADRRPQIMTDKMGHWLVVWTSYDTLSGTVGSDPDIFLARSLDNGQTWSDPVPLDTNAATDSASDLNPSINFGPEGHWIAAWTSGMQGEVHIKMVHSFDNGETWSAPTERFIANNSPLCLESDGDGNWLMIWGAYFDDEYIYTSRSEDNGASWHSATRVNPNPDRGSTGYRLTPLGLGHWVAYWSAVDEISDPSDRDIVISHSLDNGATWSNLAPLNTNAQNDSGNDEQPMISHVTDSEWIAVWSSDDSLGDTIGADADILSARSSDNGETWSDPVPFNTNASDDLGDDYAPKIVSDGNGHSIAVWSSNDTLDDTIGADYDILVARDSTTSIIPEDIDGSNSIDAVDVQLVINAALGIDIGGLNADVDNIDDINAVDVQLVINAALGLRLEM